MKKIIKRPRELYEYPRNVNKNNSDYTSRYARFFGLH